MLSFVSSERHCRVAFVNDFGFIKGFPGFMNGKESIQSFVESNFILVIIDYFHPAVTLCFNFF